MTSIEKLQANIDAYRAQLDMYNAQVEMFNAAFKPYYTLPKGGLVMAERTEVFTVYAAKNGYYAELPDNGGLVIGTTLSECCTAAQAAVAERKIAGDDSGPTADDPLNQRGKGLWQKVMKLQTDSMDRELLKSLQESAFINLYSGKPPMTAAEVSGANYKRTISFRRPNSFKL